MSRTVILHHHLFKNAGTSVDQVLKENFPGKWVTTEFPGQLGGNTQLVEKWIRETPDAVAFSSHTMVGPLPKIDGVTLISVLFLRDPIQRIRSAYRFERRQVSTNYGAVLAKQTDFAGYVRVRLASQGDRQCRNFQAYRLSSMMPGMASELDGAIAALGEVSVIGLVEDFMGSMARLKAVLADSYPSFNYRNTQVNLSKQERWPDESEDCALVGLLEEANGNDRVVLKEARSRFLGPEQAV